MYKRQVIADGAGSLFSSLSWTAGTGGFADLTLTLKSGTTTLTSVRSASGSATLSYPLTAGGTYSLVITNNSTLTNVPSYTLNTTLPRRGAFTLALKNSGGTTIATGTGQKPVSLSASVAAGNYTIVVTPVSGKGTATVTASYPGADKQVTYTYDGNDHATEINDGSTITTETLSPSGRVIRRVVKNASTQAVTEDVIFGYQDGSDSPSYSRPTAGGTVTSYLGGAGGLSVIDVGGTPTYQHANGHGDIIGTSNSAGTFTAITPTDEFGVGTVPASRLGWLGAHERFTTNTALGVMRMGVRLYDPRLGRFLEVDPVEGGSANDYDYVAGDPINSFDIDGRCRAMSRPTVADYLTGRACAPAGFRERFGYVPVFRRTRAGVRAMRANGECSWFPDTGPWWDFQNACKTHDYGYDLIRFGAIRNRKAVDDFLRNDMKADCKRRSLFKRGCRSTADNVYAAVRTFGGSVI